MCCVGHELVTNWWWVGGEVKKEMEAGDITTSILIHPLFSSRPSPSLASAFVSPHLHTRPHRTHTTHSPQSPRGYRHTQMLRPLTALRPLLRPLVPLLHNGRTVQRRFAGCDAITNPTRRPHAANPGPGWAVAVVAGSGFTYLLCLGLVCLLPPSSSTVSRFVLV